MTLAQLQSLVAVARLGSVKAAARTLGVSEPAVSAAVAGLRRELGDELYVRSGHGVALTPSGRRIAAMATDMLGLADEVRRFAGEAHGEPGLLRVAATSMAAEYAAGPLLDAFTARSAGLDLALAEQSASSFADLLDLRRADVTLGPRPREAAGSSLHALPFLRCRLAVVAAGGHRLAGRRDLPPAALAGERWLVGPDGVDPATPTGQLFLRHGLRPADVRAYPSNAAALAAAAAGDGVALALGHAALDDLHRHSLVRLDVRGTPVTDLWYATTLAPDRAAPAALALQRFAAMREATQAILTGRGGVPAARLRPPIHVTLWSSVSITAGEAASPAR